MASRYHFNLLVKKQRALDTQVLGFFNKYIRYMLIVTQLVVLTVFFSKILLDQKIVDLKESIDQKNEIIKTAQPMIAANNRLASQVKLLSGLVEKQKVAGTLVMTVLDNVPESVSLESVQYSNNECTVKGVTYRPLDIKKFEARLKKKFPNAEVSLNSISIEARRYVFEIAISDGKKA